MADIRLQNQLNMVTNVPNRFIDEFMADANGEYVKIYLYLLRCMNQPNCDFSISMIADQLKLTERDVLRAFRYWESRNLLRLEYDETHSLSGICLIDQSTADVPCAYTPTAPQPAPSQIPEHKEAHFTLSSTAATPNQNIDAAPQKQRRNLTSDELARLQEHEDFQELIFISSQYLGRTLNQTELNTLGYWYDDLDFPAELITYLIEYCIGKGHTSFRYMEKVALAWADANIHTVEQAKQQSASYSKDVYSVMHAFGIQNRNLIEPEINYIKKWTKTYGFTSDIISEACRRTLQATQKASFEYADKILTNWHQHNVHHMADIVALDSAYQKSRKNNSSAPKTAPAVSTQFNNFSQRSYNYDDLERQLLENGVHS